MNMIFGIQNICGASNMMSETFRHYSIENYKEKTVPTNLWSLYMKPCLNKRLKFNLKRKKDIH